jgi:hypothetical protein
VCLETPGPSAQWEGPVRCPLDNQPHKCAGNVYQKQQGSKAPGAVVGGVRGRSSHATHRGGVGVGCRGGGSSPGFGIRPQHRDRGTGVPGTQGWRPEATPKGAAAAYHRPAGSARVARGDPALRPPVPAFACSPLWQGCAHGHRAAGGLPALPWRVL